MMETIIYKDRENTNCEKWDGLQEQYGQSGLLPMWVADMDFEAPACVQKALKAYIEFNVYGYYKVPTGFYQSFIDWEKNYHNYNVKREWLRVMPGVVPAIYWCVQMLTEAQDSVVVMPPVYYPFFHAVKETGRNVVECPLKRDGDSYTMDMELFEKLVCQEQVKVLILCSPHNPVGRVWTRQELKEVLDLCKEHHVYMIADEIHQDLIMEGQKQITAATVGDYDEILLTVTAATKTFNLAGCQSAFLIVPDEKLRLRCDEMLKKLHLSEGNSFGYVAVQAAYENGRSWLEQALAVIRGNYQYLKKELEDQLPKAVVAPLEGTYLAWVDLSAYIEPGKTEEIIQRKCQLAVDYGEWFGGKEYEQFIRLNLATRTKNVKEAVERICECLIEKG